MRNSAIHSCRKLSFPKNERFQILVKSHQLLVGEYPGKSPESIGNHLLCFGCFKRRDRFDGLRFFGFFYSCFLILSEYGDCVDAASLRPDKESHRKLY